MIWDDFKKLGESECIEHLKMIGLDINIPVHGQIIKVRAKQRDLFFLIGAEYNVLTEIEGKFGIKSCLFKNPFNKDNGDIKINKMPPEVRRRVNNMPYYDDDYDDGYDDDKYYLAKIDLGDMKESKHLFSAQIIGLYDNDIILSRLKEDLNTAFNCKEKEYKRYCENQKAIVEADIKASREKLSGERKLFDEQKCNAEKDIKKLEDKITELKKSKDLLQWGIEPPVDKNNTELDWRRDIEERFRLALRTNELIILSGRPGAGKTSIVSKYGNTEDMTCTIVQVQSNWTDKQDLLGYYNVMNDEFIATEFLKALWEAEKDTTDKLHIICLDEMNLAPVEYYFASFLSIMQQLPEERKLVLHTQKKRDKEGNLLSFVIPSNVRFVGTLNMDAYGKSLSPKVLSRAFVIDFPPYVDTREFPSMFNMQEDKGLREPIEDPKKFWNEELRKEIETIENLFEQNELDLCSHRLEEQVKELCRVYEKLNGDNKTVLIDYILCSKVLPNIEVSCDREKAKNIDLHELKKYESTYAKLEIMKKYAEKNGVFSFFER